MIPIEFILQVNFILLMAIVMVILFLFVLKSYKKDDFFFKEELVNAVEKDLNSYLISTTENEGARYDSVQQYQIRGIRSQINSKRRRRVFVEHLIALKKSLFGEYNDVLADLYRQLGLHLFAIKRLKSFSYNTKITAIREISEFQYQPGFDKVQRLLYDKNKTLRHESQIALSKMKEEEPLFFLENDWSDLTDWHKLRLHHILKSSDRDTSVSLKKWITHKDAKVRAFIIELCILFRRVEYMQEIRSLFHDKSAEVKHWVLKAICEMGDDSDITDLVNLLKSSEDKFIRISCLEALGKVGSDMEVILITQYLRSNDQDILFAVLRAIEDISGNVQEVIEDTYDLEIPSTLTRMIAHIQDPLN